MAFESWLAEKAREELEMLEAQHPGRFNFLKLELKSLISQPESCAHLLFGAIHEEDDGVSAPPASVAPTQVSSNRKRKSGWSKDVEEKKVEKSSPAASGGRRGGGDRSSQQSCSRMEAAVRRAEACLVKIQQVKESLLC